MKAVGCISLAKINYAASRIKPQPMDAVLEVAAGICACGRALAPLAGNVVCLDMTPAMLSVGKAEAEKANLSKYDVCTGRCYGASVFGQ